MEEMREKFEQTLNAILSSKREDNKFYLSQREYDAKIQEVKMAKVILKTPSSQKSQTHYRLVNRYDILLLNGKERLIRPVNVNTTNNLLFYVTNEELFDILYSTHLEIGHGGRNRMAVELKNKYCNITKEIIMVFLRLCDQCQMKSSIPKKSSLSKSILHSNFNSRSQLDLIDMQSQIYKEYRFIMVYQDHFTKFIILKALKSKDVTEVASHLLEIYTTFGAPAILHSDSEREFINAVITELQKEWKDLRIVCGRPLFSQNQGTKENINRDIQEMLTVWMIENKSLDWPKALKYVQFQKNRAFHGKVGRSPYEALFGHPTCIGLVSTSIRSNEIPNLISEEDIDALLSSQDEIYQTNEDNNLEILEVKPEILPDMIRSASSENDTESEFTLPMYPQCSTFFWNEQGPIPDRMTFNHIFNSDITTGRKRSGKFSEKQTNKVLKTSNENISKVNENASNSCQPDGDTE